MSEQELEELEFGQEHEPDDEFFEHYKVTADSGQNPLRVDKFLMNRLLNATRNRIQNAAKQGFVRVNQSPVKSNYKVKAGDEVTLVLPHPPRNIELIPQDIPLDIVFEDDYLLIVNKQPGMVVHPGYGNYTGTLVNGLLHHFGHLPQIESDLPRPGLAHRIDKDTTGLLVIAKNEDVLSHLANQFFHHTIEREYHALVWGNVKEDQGTIDVYLMRSPQDRKVIIGTMDAEKGKRAITHYEVKERYGFATYVTCKLETGRTHQIRAHFKYLGHTLFNDAFYGGDKILAGTGINRFKTFVENTFKVMQRQALHAAKLGFEHPVTKQDMLFEQPLPSDFAEALDRFRKFNANYGMTQ